MKTRSGLLIAALMVVGGLTSCQSSATTSAKCASLSADEQRFANQLSSSNRSIFCGQLTSDQRAAAMRVSASGSGTSPDDAVQQQYQKLMGKSGGGCSVN
jgi:ABC-type molybdate transport system substrate-binding protein